MSPEPIDWTAVQVGKQEGESRHSRQAPPPPQGWTCPRCGVPQTGRLEEGCGSCGSGKPGKRVEEQPTAAIAPGGQPLQSYEHAVPTGDPAFAAFRVWEARYQQGRTDAERSAFIAGWRAAQAEADEVIDELSIPPSTVPSPLTGTAKSRTILAALELFASQVLSMEPQEVAEGEWISAEEAQDLIREAQQPGAQLVLLRMSGTSAETVNEYKEERG